MQRARASSSTWRTAAGPRSSRRSRSRRSRSSGRTAGSTRPRAAGRTASGYLQRRLSLAQAQKIADRGGVVGLWGLGLAKPGPSRTPGQGNWTVGRGDTRGYAREIANLVDWLGADHVGIGTDIEGVGTGWSVNNYAHVRSVVEALQDMKLPASAIEQVACGNYARVLKAALKG